jgi:hypothetical protein
MKETLGIIVMDIGVHEVLQATRIIPGMGDPNENPLTKND